MNTRSASRLPIYLLYSFAGLSLFAAIILLITALGFKSSLGVTLNVFAAALGPIADVIVGMLTNAIQWMGVLLAAVLAAQAFLLFTAGRHARRIREYSGRLAALEARVAELESGEAAPETPALELSV